MRILRVERREGVGRGLGKLPGELLDAIDDRIRAYVGQDHPVGVHVDYLVIEGQVVRVNGFVDTDGTYWLDSLGDPA